MTTPASIPSPSSIVVVGGGRWARVIADVLCGLVPPASRIAIHSPAGGDAMRAWASERGLSDRLSVSTRWPVELPDGTAVIVANRARDHEAAAAWALAQRCATLVEKPLAITAAAAERLVDLTRDAPERLSASQVFLFTRYLENFASRIAATGPIDQLEIDWVDPAGEERYGETKRYDPGLPVFADCLPHVIPVAERLMPDLFSGAEVASRFSRGGARCDIETRGADARACRIRLERNGAARRRVVRATDGGSVWELDASNEPGVIRHEGREETGDAAWDSAPRPLASMLTAFLGAAAGAQRDARLDAGTAVLACRAIDRVREQYGAFRQQWLSMASGRNASADADVEYALAEMREEDSTRVTDTK